ncbi:PACRG-like protein [Corticium candelabrum]|uniref:PACRG-like protein n=1 Tax=Corticium candelabrum TaxID=121492 RepID=UPI002E267C74|nr:PACRG-like protein [Corticium candelabrum]
MASKQYRSKQSHETPVERSVTEVSRIKCHGSRPSDKLNPKTIDPFDSKAKFKTSFSHVYGNGGIPCRLIHGSVKHKLQWDVDLEEVLFDPVLITLAEGLRETEHPYTFVAREAFRQLLQLEGAGEKAVPVLPRLIISLRLCLSSEDASVFSAGLSALSCLSQAVRQHLNPYLKSLLAPLSKRLQQRAHRDEVTSTLQQLEIGGGKDALAVIKSKIPTYSSVLQ